MTMVWVRWLTDMRLCPRVIREDHERRLARLRALGERRCPVCGELLGDDY